MRKNSLKQTGLKPTKSNIVSYETVLRDGWFIKLSRFEHFILLIFVSQFTGNTVVRYFDDEEQAVTFINYVIDIDPTTLNLSD